MTCTLRKEQARSCLGGKTNMEVSPTFVCCIILILKTELVFVFWSSAAYKHDTDPVWLANSSCTTLKLSAACPVKGFICWKMKMGFFVSKDCLWLFKTFFSQAEASSWLSCISIIVPRGHSLMNSKHLKDIFLRPPSFDFILDYYVHREEGQ